MWIGVINGMSQVGIVRKSSSAPTKLKGIGKVQVDTSRKERLLRPLKEMKGKIISRLREKRTIQMQNLLDAVNHTIENAEKNNDAGTLKMVGDMVDAINEKDSLLSDDPDSELLRGMVIIFHGTLNWPIPFEIAA